MEKNQTGKYLKYAIGEIVLVVIGILIALQINDWNETRKLQNTMTSVYSIIKSDLLADIENIDMVFAEMAPKDSIFKRIINNEMSIEDYLNCKDCSYILYGFPDIVLNKRGLNLLGKNSTIFDSSKDSLSLQINKFYSYFNTEIDVALEEVVIDYQDNYSYFKNNKVWFKDYLKKVKNDEFITYALTSSDYRNRVTSFHQLYFENYLEHLREYKADALVVIEKINKKIK